jgi:hypothetical protein
MKIIYAAAFMNLLLSRSTSLAEDPKRADVDPRQNETLTHRVLRVSQLSLLPLVKTSPANLRNRGLTSVGGPAIKSKNVAAINGTELKRR